MRTVGAQLIAEREGRGSVAAPSPRAPEPAHTLPLGCSSRNIKKRDISIELRMGTFLTSFDTNKYLLDIHISIRYDISGKLRDRVPRYDELYVSSKGARKREG